MTRRLRVLRQRARRDERGFFLVFVAVLLVTLLALAGFAVDFWHWNHEGSRLQKAADAAALGGSVFMPENPGGLAFTTAKEIASRNGYTHGKDDVTISVEPGARPNQLEVTITKKVSNYFGSLVGAGTTTITKHAIGEYERTVNMGSPINQFGNDPESGGGHGSAQYPDFWANVFGPSSQKNKGDAIQSRLCSGGTDNCSGTNADHDEHGYFYGIEVKAGATGPLQVEAFDAAFAHVGDNCGNNDGGSNLIGAASLPPSFNPVFPVADPAVRYSPDPASRFCSGDMYYGDQGAGEDKGPPWTTFRLLAPDDTPNDPTNNPVVCGVDFPGYHGDLRTALLQTTPQAGAPAVFAAYFRQWYRLCEVSTPEVGTYFLQVETGRKANGSAAPQGSGANRFSVRAGLNGDFSTPLLRVFGEARIGIYANVPSANTTFYLARVLPGAESRNLVVSFFDTGDAPGGSTGTLTVLPPPDSNVGASFSGCTYTPPPGTATGPPWGTFVPAQSGCKITGVSSASYNGQWIQFKIPIPDDYDCDLEDPNGCWTRINFAFDANVNDTTTWTARIEGDPVRLVE